MCKKNIDSIAHLKILKSSLRIVSYNITLSGDGNEKGQKNQ